MSILRELQRRNVLRVAAGYVAVSWLIVQVMDTLSGAFALTGGQIRTAVIVLAVGFIPALIISWAFELTPEGLKRDAEVARDTPAARKTKQHLDRFVMVALALAVAYFVIDELLIEPQEKPATFAERSIAVLPFVNMSADPEQEYFSDGISEELLNLLARIPELRVISRSSAFSYKGKVINMPDVAQELNVAHVLEGSVRKAGNTIRITAQLIHAPTDEHVWSETWDRELDDVFAIQDEIAAQVVERLRVELLGEVPQQKPVDPEAYTLYLRADHLLSHGTGDALEDAIALLERAMEIEPDYVDAMNELALATFWYWRRHGADPEDPLYVRSSDLLDQVLQIDPDNPVATAYTAWGDVDALRPVAETAQLMERAFRAAPTNDDVVRNVLQFARSIGRLDVAIEIGEFVISRDPKRATAYYQLSQVYRDADMFDKAEEAGKRAQALGMSLQYSIAKTRLYNGDPGPILDLYAGSAQESLQGLATLAMALHTAGRHEESRAALDELQERFPTTDFPVEMASVYAWLGDADRAFEWLDQALDGNLFWLLVRIDDAVFDPIRDDPRWDGVLRRLQRHPDQLATVEFDLAVPN